MFLLGIYRKYIFRHIQKNLSGGAHLQSDSSPSFSLSAKGQEVGTGRKNDASHGCLSDFMGINGHRRSDQEIFLLSGTLILLRKTRASVPGRLFPFQEI